MILTLAYLILLSTTSLVQTAEVHQPMSLTVVEVGGDVTVRCSVPKTERYVQLYKQSLGYMFEIVANGVYNKPKLVGEFENSRFSLTKKDDDYLLTIRNIRKEDEATYVCLTGSVYLMTLTNATFLAVNDRKEQKSFYMKLNPETESVQSGKSEPHQCSLLNKNKDQSPGEHSVFWFRAGSGESHPSIIYTQKNRSDDGEERSCSYSLSRTIQDSSDTGTCYCAVVTCGEILFGEGTKVEIRQLDPVNLVLGVLLVCSVTVNAVLIFYKNQRRVCEHCKGSMRASHNPEHDKSAVDQSNDLDGSAEAENYATVDFSARKLKKQRKKRESPQDSVYSAVRVQHHPSL